MTQSLLIITPLMFMFLMISLSIQLKHLLMSLFCLEAMMLSTILLITMSSTLTMNNAPFSTLIILTLSACEASLGLSLLVMMSRSFGSDNLMMSTLNKC